MTKPPRKTQQDRANQIGVAVQTLRTWKALGTNIWDDDEIRARVKRQHSIPPGLKPEYMPRNDQPATDPIDGQEVDIEAIIREIGSANDKHSAASAKIKIDALIGAYKLRAAAGKYVPVSTVSDCMAKVGAVVSASIRRLQADLPPMLDGMTPGQMKTLIGEKTDEILRNLSDASNDLWKEIEPTE
jgi:hypothetical protein